MPNELQVLLVGIVLAAVAGLAGYKIYKNWKSGEPSAGFAQTAMFILKNIDNFIEDLKEALGTMDAISEDKFENNAAYRTKLIETAVTIIEKEAAEAGITFKFSHDTLVNLAEIALTQVIKLMKTEAEQQRTIDAKVNMALLEQAKTDKVDITADIIYEDRY